MSVQRVARVAATLCAIVAAAVCDLRGTEIAQALLLTTKTTGNFHTPAMFSAS